MEKDYNTLNHAFYAELLYILGLEEKKDKIVISKTKNTLAYLIKSQYNSLAEDDIISLLINYNTRLVFLRILEATMISHDGSYGGFLKIDTIKNFSVVNDLFFEVLNTPKEKRREDLPKPFSKIPYLNSSLFDKTPLEREGNEIWRLDSRELALYPTSILKTKDKSQTTLPLLEYYLAFLQAYDFTTTPKDIQDNVKTNHDTLINSAVLGLVFEKLNGYKEGSFYTPSFITSYMCEDAINRAIITRFNAEYGWKCENLKGLEDTFKSYIGDEDEKEKFRKTFLSIRICDPAVGSGHFLVSALNYLIYMAYRLRIFGIGAEIALQNDELLIYHEGDIFQYTKPKLSDSHAQDIQQSLFHLKKSIIENCLFGVDINPNSCEITKLRLWIELLKHSYYKIEDNQITNELQTLPNIDINIKCGNSLLSNHPINSPFTTSPTLDFTKELADQIQDYKSAVQRYKDSLSSKSEIIDELEEIKTTLKRHLSENSQTSQSLRQNLKIFFNDYGDEVFDIKTDFGMDMLSIIRDKKFSKQLRTEPAPMDKKGEKLLAQIKKDYEILESMKHNNAFEWRFEFPEVLDNDGNFTGFDCVIGNPPYGVELSDAEKEKYKKIYGSKSSDTAQLFIFQADKILKPQGINSFIVPKALTFATNWKQIRDFLQDDLRQIIDCGKAWSYVLLEMIIFSKVKQSPAESYITSFLSEDESLSQVLEIDKKHIGLFDVYLNDLKKEEVELGIRIRNKCLHSLADCGEGYRGSTPYENVAKEGGCRVLGGKEIQRYYTKGVKGYICEDLKVSHKAFVQDNSVLMQRLIAHVENPLPHIKMTGTILTTREHVGILETIYQIVCKKEIPNKYVLALLHSKFLNWYCYRFVFAKAIRSFQFSAEITKRIPIPKIDSANQSIADKIIALVEEILEKKKQDSATDTTKLESQINKLVYTLYNLTDEEIGLIEKG